MKIYVKMRLSQKLVNMEEYVIKKNKLLSCVLSALLTVNLLGGTVAFAQTVEPLEDVTIKETTSNFYGGELLYEGDLSWLEGYEVIDVQTTYSIDSKAITPSDPETGMNVISSYQDHKEWTRYSPLTQIITLLSPVIMSRLGNFPKKAQAVAELTPYTAGFIAAVCGSYTCYTKMSTYTLRAANGTVDYAVSTNNYKSAKLSDSGTYYIYSGYVNGSYGVYDSDSN